MLKLVLVPVKDSTLTLTLWPLLTTSATLATRPSRRSSEMCTRPSHRFLRESHTRLEHAKILFSPTDFHACWKWTKGSGLKLKRKVPRRWPNNKIGLSPSQRKSWGPGGNKFSSVSTSKRADLPKAEEGINGSMTFQIKSQLLTIWYSNFLECENPVIKEILSFSGVKAEYQPLP